jgi:hypothetical protein
MHVAGKIAEPSIETWSLIAVDINFIFSVRNSGCLFLPMNTVFGRS